MPVEGQADKANQQSQQMNQSGSLVDQYHAIGIAAVAAAAPYTRPAKQTQMGTSLDAVILRG